MKWDKDVSWKAKCRMNWFYFTRDVKKWWHRNVQLPLYGFVSPKPFKKMFSRPDYWKGGWQEAELYYAVKGVAKDAKLGAWRVSLLRRVR